MARISGRSIWRGIIVNDNSEEVAASFELAEFIFSKIRAECLVEELGRIIWGGCLGRLFGRELWKSAWAG